MTKYIKGAKKMRVFMLLSITLIGNLSAQELSKPKLVVGIVVDQMRQEYLFRYKDLFGDDGFNRLLNHGFELKNTHYNFIPTKTGPGHASIYTGTTPKNHSIILNEWYDRKVKKEINCVEDHSVSTVGSSSKKGEFSPHLLLSPTITDQLKIATQGSSKVISLSLKNRGAILPGGHTADGAYWYDSSNGNFVTSTFYLDKLPDWVLRFNQKKWADKYLDGMWKPLFHKERYTAGLKDDAASEILFPNSLKSVLPYNLADWSMEEKDEKGKPITYYDLLQKTPFGNSILKKLALSAINNEKLGQNGETDFLAISFSSTDKVGHAFGPQSVELQDTYARLDQDLAEIFVTLDAKLGKGNYVVFLTSDHGVAENLHFMKSKSITSGFHNEDDIKDKLNGVLENKFNTLQLIEHFSDGQLYFNLEALSTNNLSKSEIIKTTYTFLADLPEVSDILLADDLRRFNYSESQKKMVQRGYHWHRSGDITVLYQPNFTKQKDFGAEHGSGFAYDSHVPLLWYGWKIPHGHSYKYQSVTDIVPTLAFMLEIKLPDAVTGQPILEILD